MKRRVIVSAPVTSGGLYAHLRNVLPRLVALRPDWSFEVHAPRDVLRTTFGDASERWMHPWPAGGRSGRIRWELQDLPRMLRADPDALLFAPFGPLWNVSLAKRAVVRLDNLIVLLDARERVVSRGDAGRLRILRYVFLANARRALIPVCASHHSRARYVDLTGLPPERFAVIPHGIDPDRVARATPSPAIEAVCRVGPYFLHVGQATPYRHTREAILAYRLLVAREPRGLPRFVWAGSARKVDRAYEAECLALLKPLVRDGKAVHLGQVGNEDVYALDRSAQIFVYPSVHEDCPNTVFEALAAGAPIVCMDIPGNREFAGEAACFLREPNPDAIAHALSSLQMDPKRRDTLVRLGRERVKSLTWEETTRRLATVLEEAFLARAGLSPRGSPPQRRPIVDGSG